jgi:integrase
LALCGTLQHNTNKIKQLACVRSCDRAMLCLIVFRFFRHFDDKDYDMATIRRRGDTWQVQVCVNRVRKSATFPTKRAAAAWAAAFVVEAQNREAGVIPDIPFAVALKRYQREVSVTKRGAKFEICRINYMLRDALASVRLPVLSIPDVAAWRDRRMRQVTPGTVLRDWSLLNHVFSVAVREWRWLKENPMTAVRKPKAPLPRDRCILDVELSRLMLAFGYRPDVRPETATARVGAAFLFAIETAMRAGEISALTWDNVSGNVARLPMTKNGFPRSVPLSSEAVRILEQLPRLGQKVFDLKTSQIDALFRKVRARAMIDDLHFHDTRHEAITRLARKLDVLDLARMVGIRDLRILMVYYNAKPEDIAVRLG